MKLAYNTISKLQYQLHNFDNGAHKMDPFRGTKNEDKIIRTSNLDYVPDSRGVGYVYFTQMKKHKDKVAQIDGQTGKKDSYGSLLHRCVRTAITMRSMGVKQDDIITLCTFNHLDSCVPFISSFFVGAKSASLDPTLSLADTIHLLKQVMPKMIFVTPEALEMIEQAVAEASPDIQIVVFGDTTKYIPFADFLQPRQQEDDFKPFEAKTLRDTIVIFFSSGTSGMPKGICLSHFAYLGQCVNTIGFGYCTDVTLGYSSCYWVTSAIFWGVCILSGTARLILSKFDPAIAWKTIDKYKPTLMFLAPSQALAMYNQGKPDGINTGSLNDLIIGGGPMMKEQLPKLRNMLPGTRLGAVYGQTEVIGILTNFKPAKPEEVAFLPHKLTSSGRAVSGVTYKVVNPETEEILGPNQRGELRVKTDFQLNGYHNMDASDAWDSEGWLKTGDVVYYDEDLCFYVVDRLKEMLKFQSWHVPPALIENVVLTHPAIEAAVVVGVPHEIDGDHPMAVVVLKKHFIGKRIAPEEIVKFVEERVHDRQRLRGGVKIVDQLPTTPTGKVKRGEVKNMFAKKQ